MFFAEKQQHPKNITAPNGPTTRAVKNAVHTTKPLRLGNHLRVLLMVEILHQLI